jgi:hypothetical protein
LSTIVKGKNQKNQFERVGDENPGSLKFKTVDLFKNLAVLSQVPLNLPHNGGKFSFFPGKLFRN